MKFGFFDDSNKEYVITNPQTPYPWLNYLGNKDYFTLITNTGGGYSFFKDPLYRRLTRYRYNNVPIDQGGKYFYIKDGNTIWSPGWKPVKTTLDEYQCRHGMGYTVIKSCKENIDAEVLSFVPLEEWGEIHKVTIKNKSSRTKTVQLFSLVEFCLWNANDDMANFQRNFSTGEVEVDGSTIYHLTEYRERRNHFAFYTVNSPINGFDTDRDSFIGLYNGFDLPDVVKRGESTNSIAHGWAPIASHAINLTLAPNGEKTFVFLLGYIENDPQNKWKAGHKVNKDKAEAMLARYKDSASVDNAFQKLHSYWNEMLSVYTIKSNDEKLSRMVNIWHQYQCMVTFNMARSASLFESGISRGLGFRDTNQDLLGCMHLIPERARERILDVAATQLADGGAYHQYQPLTKKGNSAIGDNFNDDPLWLILAVSAYLKETNDWSILDLNVPFENKEDNQGSLFEHLRRAFQFTLNNKGPHGLPLIGRADWNDCLNLNCFSTNPDESFQTTKNREGKTAESVLIAGMFIFIGREFVRICQKLGKTDLAGQSQKQIDEMEKTIVRHGWDGEWYLRAYDDTGAKVGSHECEDGKIFIESQGFCSMANVGSEQNLPQKALDSTRKHLMTPYGLVINYPAYKEYHLNLGEVSSYPPGYKENGGIFCHNNPWIMIGETVIGRGERAFEYYQKICPAYLEEISELHKTEPYVYAQMIAGKEAVNGGQAKNSWLTGTAAWNFVAISQWILGIRPDYDGLIVDPCIPPGWDGFTVTRKYRDSIYRITVSNPDHVSKGIKSIKVDGKLWEKNSLPVFQDKQEHVVELVMGTSSK